MLKEQEDIQRKVDAFPGMLAALELVRRDAINEHGRLMPSTILEVQHAINEAKGQ